MTDSRTTQLSVEKQAALQRRPSDEARRAPVADASAVDDALLRAATTPELGSAALEHTDTASRARVVSRLQQSHGNAHVQRIIQRSEAVAEAAPADDLAGRIQARVGGGSNLDSGVQRQLEHGLGADLSGVRVHTDTEADHLARSVNAVAFTSGSDIFFRHGAYNPASTEGLQTLAHEAVHTVQQASGPVEGTPSTGGVSVSDPSDRFERAATQAAQQAVYGASARSSVVSAGKSAPLQRQEAVPEQDEEEKKRLEDESAI
jgi:hypothetical protein